jgi:hypothetical protein
MTCEWEEALHMSFALLFIHKKSEARKNLLPWKSTDCGEHFSTVIEYISESEK